MESKRPHAVVIPFPLQSHIKANLELSKLLYDKGFHITFVNTEFNHNRLLKTRGSNSLDGLPHFRFETIPDGLPPSDADASQDITLLCESVLTNFLCSFLNLVAKLNKNTVPSEAPPVTCIVSDGAMPFTVEAAKQLGVPVIMSFTISACAVVGTKLLRALREKGLSPLQDESCLETTIDWIPSMKIVQLKDLPLARATDPDNNMIFKFSMECAERAVDATAIMIHTFDALEADVLRDLSFTYPRIYAVGPFHFLLKYIQDDDLKSIGYNLWKEETECLQWLDTKEPNSVVYVNFGSVAVVTAEQLEEFAMGLVNSMISFLWIIRPDLVIGDSAILSPGFAEATGKRGFIASWCPQEEVLNHPSIGGFLTHCGWNSILESLGSGVPMICWPFAGDQHMNCRFTCSQWGVGMEIDNNVKRDEVDKLVRELMKGEKGKKMKEKAMEWKRLAEEATSPNGSSSINLEKMINEVLLSNN